MTLFELAFSKKLSRDFWLWRFKNNPFSPHPMTNLMWDEEILTGHSAVSALPVVVGKQKVLAGLSGTAMTNPEYLGKGIFSSLALNLYDRVKKTEGVSLILGFPNPNSHYAIVNKIGRKDVAIITNFCCKAEDIAAKKLESHLKKLSKFNKSHEDFIADIIVELGFSVYVDRSVDYLNWRYFECPVNEYYCFEILNGNELHGVVVLKQYQPTNSENTEIDIVEIFCSANTEILRDILGHVNSYLKNSNGLSSFIYNLWMSLFDPRHILLERIGFRIGMPLTYMCVKSFSPDYDEVYNYKNWYISMGDSDLY